MVRAGCAATTCAPAPCPFIPAASQSPDHRSVSRRASSTHHFDFLINVTAIRNACNSPENNIIVFSNRLKIASLRPCFALLASLLLNHFSPLAIFLIASRQILKIGLTHSQQTRKHFLIASFSALFSASCLARPSVYHARPSLERRDRLLSAHAPFSESESPEIAGSLTVARWSSKLLVSTGPAIRSSARAAINCEGEDRCRNALFSRMCGAAIKSTAFASA
jgi:hypothetical protein